MSEKCYYLNEGLDGDCSKNDGYSGFPDECDDCGEFFCSKHLKLHKKDGTCKKIQNEFEEDDDFKEVRIEERNKVIAEVEKDLIKIYNKSNHVNFSENIFNYIQKLKEMKT